jgi:hypothetical protein
LNPSDIHLSWRSICLEMEDSSGRNRIGEGRPGRSPNLIGCQRISIIVHYFKSAGFVRIRGIHQDQRCRISATVAKLREINGAVAGGLSKICDGRRGENKLLPLIGCPSQCQHRQRLVAGDIESAEPNVGLEICRQIEIRCDDTCELIDEAADVLACGHCSMTGRDGVSGGIPQRIGDVSGRRAIVDHRDSGVYMRAAAVGGEAGTPASLTVTSASLKLNTAVP